MRYKIFFLVILISVTLGVDVTHTWAAGWHYYDPECPVSLGDKTMKFVAMQPKKILTGFVTPYPIQALR